jgi:predicted small secreted protein
MKHWIAGLLLGLVLAGCNTMRGVGQDIEQAGQAIKKSADR